MPSAEVTLEVIDDVAADLRRYVEQTGRIRQEFDTAAASIMSFLDDVIRARRRGAEHARAELEQAVEAQRYSPNEETHWTSYTNTWSLEAALQRASESVEAALRVKERVALQLRECGNAITANSQAVGRTADSTQAMLRQKREELVSYWTGVAQIGQGSPVAGPSAHAATSPPAAAAAGGPASIGVAAAGLPPGFVMVPVTAIDDADSHVDGPDKFGKGYSPEDLKWAHEAFVDVVLPVLSRGGTIDDLRARDAAESRSGARSYADTYHGFLGDSAIHLNRDLTVANGYHRIWVAKQMGLESVPARIS